MSLLLQAIRWAVTAAAGWAVSDYYTKRTEVRKLEAESGTAEVKKSEVEIAKETAKSNWIKWIAIIIVAAIIGTVVLLITNPFNKTKK